MSTPPVVLVLPGFTSSPGEKLSSLTELDLSGNAVSGPVELVLQTLLGTLPALEVLDISGNDVSLHEEAEADASGGTQQEKSSLLLLKGIFLSPCPAQTRSPNPFSFFHPLLSFFLLRSADPSLFFSPSLLPLSDRWLLDALRSSFAGGLGSSLRELSLLGNPCCLGLTEDRCV